MSSASPPSSLSQMVNLVFFFLYSLLCTFAVHSADNYLTGDIAINCGSTGISTAFNNKEWIGDITESKSTSSIVIKGSSTASTAFHNLVSTDSIPYKTARISRKQFSYTFQVSPGQKLIRLHFSPASYYRFKKFKDFFTVEAGAFTLLRNFSASLTADALGVKSLVKEYCMNIEQNQPLSIIFSPEHSQSDKTYAFINGIEVISMPSYLSYSHDDDLGARVVGQKSRFYIDNNTALEMMQRLNFKWDPIPYLGMFGKWATVPDEKIKDFTWKTSVDVGFGYLLRLHFCERGLQMAETRNSVFSVSINDMIAETNVDIGKERSVVSGIHLHRDYMVTVKGNKEDGSRDLSISLQLKDELVTELFRGLEILKLSNHDNSLASPNPSPPGRSSKSARVQNLLSFFGHGNAIATGAVIIISLVNIITYKLREIWEDNCTDSGYKPSSLTGKLCRPFSLTEIQSATENFNDALVIGRGGFGKVYRGFISKAQKIVAIKRLKSNSRQGAREFWTEVETLSQLQHTNIISLIGYCNECQEMILLYEYVPSGTLADHLFGLSGQSDYHSSLSWEQRLRICTGVGRGLDYLHTGTDQGIIHRDIKASNILLDENLEAKISDFGLAKARKRNCVQSYVSTNVKGTYGYFDPDYFRTRRLRRKSDTYAFGVVLLEVLCERPALDRRVEEDKQRILAIWAQDCISKGEIDRLVAPSLRAQISPESLMTFLEVAKRCLHDEPNKRPTMAQVVVQLESALEQQESSKSSAPEITSSDSVVPRAGETLHSINTEIEEMSSVDEQNMPLSLTERSKMAQNTEPSGRGAQVYKKNKIAYKLPRFRPWNALWKRANMIKKTHLSIPEYFGEEVESHRFDLATIAAATNNFSLPNEIGAGAFGTVYKGLLSTGKEVAIKRLSSNSYQADSVLKNEVLLLSKLQHPNLIKLLGYCLHGQERMLVYELMEKKSLNAYLFGEKRHEIGWTIRFNIFIGIARGILHLHQDSGLRIIHRDIKVSNILLDKEMNPKISGFGLACTLEEHQAEMITLIAGTIGYISPECLRESIISVKSDVYSFGVLVLEIVSGRSIHSAFPDLIVCVWKMWNEGKALEFLDKSMKDEFPADEALRCIQVGLLCIQKHRGDRPTMQSVLEMLEGEVPSLPQPLPPPYFENETYSELKTSTHIDTTNEVTITELECR
ncbi:putative receptor-like protein kinase At5g39000 [Olea europaea var. sylvestris]|uniref:putative receptor-like protein kinase At5g39000 n=1 Tax=Olea europaea var. sylvestris TaxID=158386 RepID=UPI000C1CEEB2|nr:putative receptor-like protein kinase At5g39000 [Olea europaea var. sylvestris]